ncbi:DUF2201 family putative metallopeptidase [Modicisalibacter luteus]|uniref:Putative metallopeptidase domain-containing protein n=1 Tax=Modicisalibacter luteus TaxID=453962 RepID=A0ABV7M5K9_9GAMM|nr:hypothetical protein [Halomonas lutea]
MLCRFLSRYCSQSKAVGSSAVSDVATLAQALELKTQHKAYNSLEQWLEDRDQWKITQPATALLGEGVPVVPVTHRTLKTAVTDGTHLYVNPQWSKMLDDASRRFVHAHLIWHCAANHCRLPSARDERRWHLACDHQVNTQLLQLGFELPMQAVLFPACIGKTISKVYDWLADNPLMKEESSLDELPWPSGERQDRCGPKLNGSPEAGPLRQYWSERSFRVVRAYAGASSLPAPVASWLLAQWPD